jgi:four helix bundle protein
MNMTQNPMKLRHEDLDVYQVAIKFLALSSQILDRYPRGLTALRDQLRKASLSIPLNIAEGYGKRSPKDRARFYDIARGSAHECGAILDASQILGVIKEREFRDGKMLLHRVVSMLVKLAA